MLSWAKGFDGLWAQCSCRSVRLFRALRKQASLKTRVAIKNWLIKTPMSGTTVGGCEARIHGGIRRRALASATSDTPSLCSCEARGWIRLSAERLENVMPCQLTSFHQERCDRQGQAMPKPNRLICRGVGVSPMGLSHLDASFGINMGRRWSVLGAGVVRRADDLDVCGEGASTWKLVGANGPNSSGARYCFCFEYRVQDAIGPGKLFLSHVAGAAWWLQVRSSDVFLTGSTAGVGMLIAHRATDWRRDGAFLNASACAAGRVLVCT